MMRIEPTFEDRIPVRWRALVNPPEEMDLRQHLESNLTVLQAACAIGESVSTETLDERQLLGADLARLETKLNLLLDMTGALLSREGLLPASVPVELTSRSIRWESDRPPKPGDFLEIALYPCTGLPKPVVLVAVVHDVQATAAGFRVDAEWFELAQALNDALEKMIFRNHRRRVALTRRENTQLDADANT
jgi:hypothetical protein